MSINRDDLFLAIKKKTSITREELYKKLRKKNLHESKKCEKAIREILEKNPQEIIKNVSGKCYFSVDEIVKAIKINLLTGQQEEIDVRLVSEPKKIEYKRFNLENRESLLSLIKHPDLPKSHNFVKNSMTRCFGCDWHGKKLTYRRSTDKYVKRDTENQLVDHYRNEIISKNFKTY